MPRNPTGRKCGAKRRNGQPCRQWALRGYTRCRLHGGASVKARAERGELKNVPPFHRYLKGDLTASFEHFKPMAGRGVAHELALQRLAFAQLLKGFQDKDPLVRAVAGRDLVAAGEAIGRTEVRHLQIEQNLESTLTRDKAWGIVKILADALTEFVPDAAIREAVTRDVVEGFSSILGGAAQGASQ